ncbi:MAG: hypothetical protein EOM55_00295 [Clostridia bacterium]|nr:hypothetical protein [Clostridia bacterium]
MRNLKKLFFGIFLLLCFSVPMMTACEASVTSFTVLSGTLDTELEYNEELDFDDLEILLNFADGTSKVVKYADFEEDFSFDSDELDILSAGDYEIKITYKGNEIIVSVTVLAPKIIGFEIDTSNMDLIIGHGSIPIWGDLIVKAVYADGSKVALESGYLIDATSFNPNITGTYTVNVGYQGFSTLPFDIEVLSATEDDLQLDLTNVELDYGYGVTPNFENLIVRSVFSDNSTQTVVNYNISFEEGYSVTTPGTYTVTITKGTLSKTFEITIAEPVITRFEIDTTDMDLIVGFGSIPIWQNLIVTTIYEDGDRVVINSGYLMDTTAFNPNIAGTYVINVGYQDFEITSFEIQVLSVAETGLQLDLSNVRCIYNYAENPNFDDLKVYTVFSDDSTLPVVNYDIEIEDGFSNSTPGTYTVTITKGDLSETFQITIAESGADPTTFFNEGDTLVLFKGAEYTFDVLNLTYTGEDSVTTAVEGTTLILNELGNYILNYDKDGVPTSKNIRVVPWISTFGVGAGITNYINNTGVNSTFLDSDNIVPFTVGSENEFYFDVVMNSSFVTDESYITYTCEVFDEETQAYVTDENLVLSKTKSSVYGVGILFNSSFVGRKIRVTIKPKYNNRTPISFEFVLNNGVNVYNDAELKSAFGNLSVQSINILRTIIVTLSGNQTNPDGSPLNYSSLSDRVIYDGNDLTSNNTGNPYVRYSESKTGDNLILNGNYQTIDASGLKLINPAYLGVNGQVDNLLNGSIEDENAVLNSQISIFRSEIRDVSKTGATTTNEFNSLMNNIITYNNLLIVGNTITPDTQQGNELYENSGSHSAIRSSYTDVTTNNCILKNVCLGINLTSSGTDAFVNYTKIYETWANDIYGHTSNLLNVTNSYLGSAGGSAIWMTDNNISDSELNNPKVIIDLNTTIINLVSGGEAWFIAQNMSPIVPTFKSTIEDGLSGTGKTILKHFTYDGQPVSKFNFSVVIHEDFGNTQPTGQMSGTMQIGGIIVSRANTTAPSGAEAIKCEPTILASQEFADKVLFYMGLGYSQEQAQTAAYLYFSSYLEVVTPVPGVGTVHILMSLYNSGAD